MKVIYNTILPRKGFKAINLFGFVFARKEHKHLSSVDLNHEKIHTRQMQELLFVFFYLWYGIEWIIRLIQYRNSKQAYFNISFEREAYCNEQDLQYLKKRSFYRFFKYLSIPKTKYKDGKSKLFNNNSK